MSKEAEEQDQPKQVTSVWVSRDGSVWVGPVDLHHATKYWFKASGKLEMNVHGEAVLWECETEKPKGLVKLWKD